MWDLIVIGGGAAGLWAAGTAAARGRRVLVLEKNRKPGVKILMSGGTRCNITHNCDVRGILDAFGQQGRFLKSSIYDLPPEAVVAEFHRLGVATKVEESGKVFPISDRAIDVRDALLRRLEAAGGELRSGVAVVDLQRSQSSEWQVFVADAPPLMAGKVLLCCGGLSYPGCGTTGDGYAWAERFGHHLVRTLPALTPLLSPAAWVHQLTGITLPDAEVRVAVEGSRVKDPRAISRGGFLLTHFGCSGPTAMNVSRFIAELERPQSASLQVDLMPNTSEAKVTQALAEGGRKLVSSVVQAWVPKNLSATLLHRAHVQDGTTLAELNKKSRQALIADLKRLCIPLCGTRGYAKAEVTAGGVSTKEVNQRTMESRLAAGLFLAGEILDVDGPIGGFNFQAAFATGHAAAMNA